LAGWFPLTKTNLPERRDPFLALPQSTEHTGLNNRKPPRVCREHREMQHRYAEESIDMWPSDKRGTNNGNGCVGLFVGQVQAIAYETSPAPTANASIEETWVSVLAELTTARLVHGSRYAICPRVDTIACAGRLHEGRRPFRAVARLRAGRCPGGVRHSTHIIAAICIPKALCHVPACLPCGIA
jgi:hypothetical protein